jgi:hypothetical protein
VCMCLCLCRLLRLPSLSVSISSLSVSLLCLSLFRLSLSVSLVLPINRECVCMICVVQEPCEQPHDLLHPSRTPQHTHTHTHHTHCHTHASRTPQHLSMTHQHPSLGLLDHSPELYVHEPQRIFGGRGGLGCDSSPRRRTSCNLPPSFSPPIRSIDLSPPLASPYLSPPLASPYLNASHVDISCPRQSKLSGQYRSALPSSAHLGILAGSETGLACDSKSYSSPVVTTTHLPPPFSPPIRSCTKKGDNAASAGDASFSSISCDPLGSLFGGPLSDLRSVPVRSGSMPGLSSTGPPCPRYSDSRCSESPVSFEPGQGFASLSLSDFFFNCYMYFNDGCITVN